MRSHVIRALTGIQILVLVAGLLSAQDAARSASRRPPNILFAIADDWGWPHAGAYGDRVVRTPTFDSIAARGVFFDHAFVSSPSCTPSRGAILTGQFHWRLGTGANLYGAFRDDLATYVDLLGARGYVAGCSGKAWGPGRPQTRGRQLAGRRYKNFGAFLAARPADKPFVYWLGSSDPHRPYKLGTGVRRGMDLSKVHLFGHFPDQETVRSDVADYYFEVERFDRLVGAALAALEKAGELDNTLVVMTGDHGMPFPRCKSHLYDAGTRVPLAAMWGKRFQPQRVPDLVSLTDLAPTFLAAAGLPIPEAMTGRSLLGLMDGDEPQAPRPFVLFGKERHVVAQEAPETGGYPCRAIRTADFLYIRNFVPSRWPSGTGEYEKATTPGAWYADTDNGPTKSYIIDNRDRDEAHRRSFALCFAKRPAEELYDLRSDPDQLRNVAGDPKFADRRQKLAAQLETELKRTGDPRVLGTATFDAMPYTGGAPRHPSWRRRPKRRKK